MCIVCYHFSALQNVDDVIAVVRQSKDSNAAKDALKSKYGLSDEQTDAIVALRLGRLTALETKELQTEHETLVREIADRDKLMSDDLLVYEVMNKKIVDLAILKSYLYHGIYF